MDLDIYNPYQNSNTLGTTSVLHVSPGCLVPPLAADEVYVGAGEPGSTYFVATPWADPFSACSQLGQMEFHHYVNRRCDTAAWLRPLVGKKLVCTCDNTNCPAGHLAERANDLFASHTDDQLHHSDADEECDTDVIEDHGPVTAEVIETLNETLRTPYSDIHRKPSWPETWHLLLGKVRLATTLLFWEIFAGVAMATKQFSDDGWEVAPPLDTIIDIDFDVFHPEFLLLILGIIFEGRIGLLHLGTPCSTFSMAFNRFPSLAIRSAQYPGGLPGLLQSKQLLVDTGNALAKISVKLASAQNSVGNGFVWEQPETSLQLVYEPVMLFFAAIVIFWAVSHLCMYGAPWKKPTILVSNYDYVLAICCICDGTHDHQSLADKAPCGTPWTKLASPYWPRWVRAYAIAFRPLRGKPYQQRSDRRSGWLAPSTQSVGEILRHSGFQPSSHRHIETIAKRIGALAQPGGRSAPQLLPDGLNADTHLHLALRTEHPFKRPLDLPPHVTAALNKAGSTPNIIVSRTAMIQAVLRLKASLTSEETNHHDYIDCHIAPVITKRDVLLMRELQYVTGDVDYTFIHDYLIGLPMLDWTRRAMGQRHKVSPPESSIDQFMQTAATRNQQLLNGVKSTGTRSWTMLVMPKWLKSWSLTSSWAPSMICRKLAAVTRLQWCIGARSGSSMEAPQN